MELFRRSKQPMPLPVTVGDCILLYQMGYEVVVHDGRAVGVRRIDKKKSLTGCSQLSSKSYINQGYYSTMQKFSQMR